MQANSCPRHPQVPGDTAKPGGHRLNKPPDNPTLAVGDRCNQRCAFFIRFSTQLLGRREWRILTLLTGFRLGFLALLLQRFEAIFLDPDQEVCATWRVGRIPKRLTFGARTTIKGNPVIDILDRENRRSRVLPCRLAADRRVVIQDPNATAKCADNEVILTRLNLEVAHGNRRDTPDFMPSLAFICRYVEARFRSDKEQLGVNVILHD